MWKQLSEFGSQYLENGFISFIFSIIVILMIAMLLSRILKNVIIHRASRKPKFALRIKNIIIYSFASYAILMQIIPLQRIGTTLLASSGVVAVVLGLAAQEALGNLINGMMISVFKPFRIGDLIKMNNGQLMGTVEDISLRHTVIKTFENTKVMVPNSEMNKATLENVTDNGNQKASFMEVVISYDADVQQAMQIIENACVSHPSFIDIRTPQEVKDKVPKVITRLVDFKEHGICLKTTIYSKDNATGFVMLCDIRLAIKETFDKQGIAFAQPSRIVSIKNLNQTD